VRFTYRRIPSFQHKALEHKHTKKGVEDKRAIVDAVLEYALLGWDGVQDAEGQPVPFSSDLIKYLPEAAKAALMEHFYENDPAKAAEGN
jgi:hypothetical protein